MVKTLFSFNKTIIPIDPKTLTQKSKDLYYTLIDTSWPQFILLLLTLIIMINVSFTFLYLHFGGVEGTRPESFIDHFFFSVQTLTTIGYGEMHPTTPISNLLVTIEVTIGLFLVSLMTGLMFAKFSRPISKIVFSNVAVIGKRNGKSTFSFRIANKRGNHLLSTKIQVSLLTFVITKEGERIRRFHDLKLSRDHTPLFSLSWFVMHDISKESPLNGLNKNKFKQNDMWIVVSFTGHDKILSKTIYDQMIYKYNDIKWDSQFVDALLSRPDRTLYVDFDRFHETKHQ